MFQNSSTNFGFDFNSSSKEQFEVWQFSIINKLNLRIIIDLMRESRFCRHRRRRHATAIVVVSTGQTTFGQRDKLKLLSGYTGAFLKTATKFM